MPNVDSVTEKSAAHTPGPWTVHMPGSVRACDGSHDTVDGCRTIVEAEIIGIPRAEAEANARLIAAAPDLLQLVREALDAFENRESVINIRDWVTSARAAIARAEGR